jgi:hypothetical protein
LSTISPELPAAWRNRSHFNFHHYRHRPPEIEVETISLDDFLTWGGTPPSLVKLNVEGAELRNLQGAAGILRNHRPILFYESFNHRVQILALLKVYRYLVFESDRHQVIEPATTSFIAVPNECAPAVTSALAALGYPISSPCG